MFCHRVVAVVIAEINSWFSYNSLGYDEGSHGIAPMCFFKGLTLPIK